MENKLEITKKLEDMTLEGTLDKCIAILNLPSPNYCEKRGERVYVDGRLQQSCFGCITQNIKSKENLGINMVKDIINFFSEKYGTKFITINGRGDPFHPRLKKDNLEKICYANKEHNIQGYVFTAGNNLDEKTCKILAANKTNVMISLFGNNFIDADFFYGKEYPIAPKPLQNQFQIVNSLRKLVNIYKESSNKTEEGITRIGMNYVVSEKDLADGGNKIKNLKQAANDNNIFFVVNTPFQKHSDIQIQRLFEKYANEYSDFHLRHSTAVNGQCQMGAGSSVTVDHNGMLLRCPYMGNEDGNGKFQELSSKEIEKVIEGYMWDRSYPCVMRKHQID